MADDDETVASDAEVRADGFENVQSLSDRFVASGDPHVPADVEDEDQGADFDDVSSVHLDQEEDV